MPTINGKFTKQPHAILGGFLALDMYNHSLTGVLAETLRADQGEGRLDLGCVAMQGTWGCGGDDERPVREDPFAATAFLLELMTRLQSCGTAPALDFRAYARWLDQCEVREAKTPSAKKPGRPARV